jgi:signal transduction histidine kinase
MNIYFSIQTQQNVIDSQQKLISQEAADAVRSFIMEKFSELESGIRLCEMGVSTEEEQRKVLEKLLGFEHAFRQIAILDMQGREIMKVSRLSTLQQGYLTDEIMHDFLINKDNERQISQIHIDETTSEPLVVIAVPMTDIFGEMKGILVAEVNLKFMWDMVAGIKIGETGTSYVVDAQGNLIAFSDISRVLRRENLMYLDEVSEFVGGNEKTHVDTAEVSIGIQGEQAVTTHAHLGSPDWAVVVEMPVAEAYRDVIMELTLSIAVMIMSFILAILAGLYLSRRITRPIINLRDAAIKIGKGDLDTMIKVKTRDEIGELASAFVQMTGDLKRSKSKLEDYSRNLEKKVRERTKELEIKDKKLLSQNVELKRLDKEKDEFISIAAHELKTPLTSIKGFSQLMQDDRIMEDKEKRKHYLELVNQNTVRLYNLILDLVDSSRLSLGKLKLDVTEVDANRISSDIRENMNMVIKEKGITPVFKIDKDLPMISADPERLMQIIRNLIVNAVHFTPKGGTISLTIMKKGNFVQFGIKDTGEGIPKEKQKNIFSRFYQADASLTRKVKGSGLGLSICHGLVQLMGGKIWFSSEGGKGTTFYFTIPIYKGGAKIGKKDNGSG